MRNYLFHQTMAIRTGQFKADVSHERQPPRRG